MLSWIESANTPECHFPLQNLPYGVFRHGTPAPRCGVAIGDQIVDLHALWTAGLLLVDKPVFASGRLNDFMALGPKSWTAVRETLLNLLGLDGSDRLRNDTALRQHALVPMAEASMQLPFEVSGYTDFFSSRDHALNAGRLLRGPDAGLAPNWLHMPIGYNGRASTVVVSGTDVVRPLGQTRAPGVETPTFGPCRKLDFELEMGTVVGLPSTMGRPLTLDEADDLIFGYVLLNDWSARDIQAWEAQPLGPFQAKAFATSISPWVVTKAALEPFRTSTPGREKSLLPYLSESRPMLYDLELEVRLQPEQATSATTVARTNMRTNYYSPAQQLAHHAIGGCLMRTGDLLGSGTISGPQPGQRGSMLEISMNGQNPITLEQGDQRSFLEDGDTVVMSGWADGGQYRVGFGTCEGRVRPSPSLHGWAGQDLRQASHL